MGDTSLGQRDPPPLADERARAVAKLVMDAPEEQHVEMLRRLRNHVGDAITAQVAKHLPQTLIGTYGESEAGRYWQLSGEQLRSPTRRTAQSPDLPEASASELTDDPPISYFEPSQPPEVRAPKNGMVCVRGWCNSAWDRNETDQNMSPTLRLFELRIIKKLYGPKATRAWMKRNERDYHAYRNTTQFCAPRGTTLAQVQEKLRLWAAPQVKYDKPQRNRPVVSGDESELHINFDDVSYFLEGINRLLGLEIPIRGGMVTHFVDEASGTVANVTQADHVLHPGYILRWAEQLPDGCFVINTLGRGLGGNPRINETAGANMFTELDDAIVRDLSGSVVD